MLSVQEAQAQILAALKPVAVETIPLAECAGRILAEDILAPGDLPPFDNSSMDGFAVRSADVLTAQPDQPVTLKVVADIPAGAEPSVRVGPGSAARIMTGAHLPEGADAVVPVEETNLAPGPAGQGPEMPLPEQVLILQSAAPGSNVRPRGQDVHQGQQLLEKGRLLQAQDVGMLASVGHSEVRVYRRPRVALFSSGDELMDPGQPLKPGQIYDSNQYVLAALLEKAGAEVIRLGTAPDDPARIEQMLTQGLEQQPDIIVTSAGVSVGAFDYVRQVIEANGRLTFWRVNMRPGKPLAFGSFGGVALIGLPGNPVSAYMGCRVFVLPAVYRLSGRPDHAPDAGRVRAVLAEDIESDGRESYLRACVSTQDGQLTARLTGHQGSGNIHSLVQANALLIVPSGVKSLPSGSEVEIWFLDQE